MNLLNRPNDILVETLEAGAREGAPRAPADRPEGGDLRVDDALLMQQIAAGDQAAFRELYDRYANRLYRYALLHLRSSDAAEDAVQETLLAVWRQPTRYRAASSLSSFLFGICHHKVVDLMRKSSKEQPLEALPEAAAAQSSPEDRLAAAEALQALPDEMRSVLILAFYVGLSYEEIARTLSIPVGTVKSRVFTARKRLQISLAGQQ